MGLFGDKKKGAESLKTLSEKEIQSRLYGHLRTTDRIIQEDLPTLSKPRQESQPLHKSSESLKSLTPTASTAIKATAPDLFADVAIKDKQLDTDNFSKAEERKTSLASKIHFKKPSEQPSHLKVAPFANFQQISNTIGQGIKKISSSAVEILTSIVSSLVGLLLSVDLRKPAVRRLVYALAIGLALFLVFSGIHHLNKNREKAMKAPHHKKVVQPKKSSVQTHPSEPLESALNAETSEIAAQSSVEKSSDIKDTAVNELKKTKRITEKQNLKPLVSDSKKVSTPSTTPKEESKTVTTAAPLVEGPSAVIQVATFATQEDAGKLVEKFKAAGFNSFLKSVSRSGGRVYFCVYIGKFKTQQEAEAKLAEFKKQEVARSFQDAFVRSF